MLEELQDFRHHFWAFLVPTGLRRGAYSWSRPERQQLVENLVRRRAEWEFPSLAWQGCGRDGVVGSLLLGQGNELKCQHRAFSELLSQRDSCRNN